MPWGDWQFWVVTIAAVVGVAALVRVLLPARKKAVKTSLTIGGEPASKRRR